MNDLTAKIKLLESQLSRSNHRVSELESGLQHLQKLMSTKSKLKKPEILIDELKVVSAKAINPPVKVREERLAAELEQAAIAG